MKFEIYQRLSGPALGQWRWRLKARNGRIVADSGEAYSSERAVRRAIHRMWMLLVLAPPQIEVVDQ